MQPKKEKEKQIVVAWLEYFRDYSAAVNRIVVMINKKVAKVVKAAQISPGPPPVVRVILCLFVISIGNLNDIARLPTISLQRQNKID